MPAPHPPTKRKGCTARAPANAARFQASPAANASLASARPDVSRRNSVLDCQSVAVDDTAASRLDARWVASLTYAPKLNPANDAAAAIVLSCAAVQSAANPPKLCPATTISP